MHGTGVVEKCTQTQNYLSQNCTFVFPKCRLPFHTRRHSVMTWLIHKKTTRIFAYILKNRRYRSKKITGSQIAYYLLICRLDRANCIEQIYQERAAVDDGRLMMYEGLTSIDIPLSTGLSSARSNPIDFLFGHRCKLRWERENSPLLPNKPPNFDSI